MCYLEDRLFSADILGENLLSRIRRRKWIAGLKIQNVGLEYFYIVILLLF